MSDAMPTIVCRGPSPPSSAGGWRTADLIADLAAGGGMRRLREDGLAKVRQGVTSLPEVLRVLGGTT